MQRVRVCMFLCTRVTCVFQSVASLQTGSTVYDKSMDWPDVGLLACAGGDWQRAGMSLVMHDVAEPCLAVEVLYQ